MYTERVCSDESVETENQKHLGGSNQSASTLTDNVGDCGRGLSDRTQFPVAIVQQRTGRDIGQLGCERSGARGISKLDLGRLILVVHLGHLVGDRSEVELWRVILSVSRERHAAPTSATDLFHGVLLPGLGHGCMCGLLGLDEFGVKGLESRRDGRRRLVESGGDLALLLVYLFQSFVSLMFGDLFEVILGTVQQGDTDVGLLQSTDIIGTVSSHQGDVTESLHGRQDVFLLRRRDTGVDPGMLNQVDKGRLVLVLFHGGASDTDVVIPEDRLVKGLARVDRNDLSFGNVSPDEF